MKSIEAITHKQIGSRLNTVVHRKSGLLKRILPARIGSRKKRRA